MWKVVNMIPNVFLKICEFDLIYMEQKTICKHKFHMSTI